MLTTDDELRTLLTSAKTIAVVGASPKPWRDSGAIADFLMKRGYTVYPVNPRYTDVLGVRCYPDLKSLPGPVDILSPQDGQALTNQPQFTWAVRPTATRYVLFVRNKVTLVRSKLIVESTGCTSMCAVTVGVPLENGEYWMRVKSRDAAGGLSNSVKHHFTVSVPPATPTPDGTATVMPTPSSTSASTLTPTPTNNPNATLPVPPTPAGFRSP